MKKIFFVFLTIVIFTGLGMSSDLSDLRELMCDKYSHALMRLYEEEDACYHAVMVVPDASFHDCINESASEEIKKLQDNIANLKCEHNPSFVEKKGAAIAIVGIPLAKEVLERVLD